MSDADFDDLSEARLVLRPLTQGDVDAVQALQRRCFPTLAPWTRAQLENHVATFPEGQLVIELDGEVVASSSALILSSKEYEDEHSFDEIVPDGTLALHDPSGDVLYGVDMCVSPDTRGMRLARRLYQARKELVDQQIGRAHV